MVGLQKFYNQFLITNESKGKNCPTKYYQKHPTDMLIISDVTQFPDGFEGA
jgi:hypothetical protein